MWERESIQEYQEYKYFSSSNKPKSGESHFFPTYSCAILETQSSCRKKNVGCSKERDLGKIAPTGLCSQTFSKERNSTTFCLFRYISSHYSECSWWVLNFRHLLCRDQLLEEREWKGNLHLLESSTSACQCTALCSLYFAQLLIPSQTWNPCVSISFIKAFDRSRKINRITIFLVIGIAYLTCHLTI